MAYLISVWTSTALGPSFKYFVHAIVFELVTLGYHMAETFARNVGLLSEPPFWGGVLWVWPFWGMWLLVTLTLHGVFVWKGHVVSMLFLTGFMIASTYQFMAPGW